MKDCYYGTGHQDHEDPFVRAKAGSAVESSLFATLVTTSFNCKSKIIGPADSRYKDRQHDIGCLADSANERSGEGNASHHLSVLKQFGLVTSRKEGKHVFYAINRDNVVECCGQLIAKFDAEEACEM